MKVKQSVIIKTYKGNEENSRRLFEYDKIEMQRQGYFPTSINYTPGSWGCSSFLIAALLIVIIIGIVAFFYMIIVKPAGYLSVTYELKDEEKVCPMCAEKVKYEAKRCKHCGHELPPNPIVKIKGTFDKPKNHESPPNPIVKREETFDKPKNFVPFVKSTDFANNKYSIIALIIVVITIISYVYMYFYMDL